MMAGWWPGDLVGRNWLSSPEQTLPESSGGTLQGLYCPEGLACRTLEPGQSHPTFSSRSHGPRLMSNCCQFYLILSTGLTPSRPLGWQL